MRARPVFLSINRLVEQFGQHDTIEGVTQRHAKRDLFVGWKLVAHLHPIAPCDYQDSIRPTSAACASAGTGTPTKPSGRRLGVRRLRSGTGTAVADPIPRHDAPRRRSSSVGSRGMRRGAVRHIRAISSSRTHRRPRTVRRPGRGCGSSVSPRRRRAHARGAAGAAGRRRAPCRPEAEEEAVGDVLATLRRELLLRQPVGPAEHLDHWPDQVTFGLSLDRIAPRGKAGEKQAAPIGELRDVLVRKVCPGMRRPDAHVEEVDGEQGTAEQPGLSRVPVCGAPEAAHVWVHLCAKPALSATVMQRRSNQRRVHHASWQAPFGTPLTCREFRLFGVRSRFRTS